jgi:prepilin-type N-terminal cleavage/methylation domain-containing protein
MRKAFTLIEMMISISILSILMLFLYKSYAELNRSNTTYTQVVKDLQKQELIKKILYLDVSLASQVTIIHRDRKKDVVFLQTNHSLHKRIIPYVAYILKGKRLYRLESLRNFKGYPLDAGSDFVVDDLGEATLFRMYKGKTKKNLFVLHVKLKKQEDILLKIKALNI